MKRKVCQVGPATLMVSLPAKWTKKYNVKKGDEVTLNEKGNILELWGGNSVHVGETKVEIKKSTDSNIRAIIGNIYKKGYDKIIFHYEDESALREIQSVVDWLLGIEVVSRRKKECEVRNIAMQLESEFDDILKNSFILLLELSEEIFYSLKNKEFSQLEEIHHKAKVITKYTDFCKRILNKHRNNQESMIFEYLVVWNLEKISNQYRYIYQFCSKHSVQKVSKATLQFFEEVNKALLLFYQAFYEKNNKKIEEISKIKDQLLFHTYYDLRKKLSPDEHIIVSHLVNIMRKLWDISGPFYGLNY
ncbi:hypothetical protein HOE37_05305 [Candidatus Woesearchaeota archaeon]|jgi:phosphate uptake regulator|nr:hypothetical protein [Candidatus Woesearchaeota archaeon]MBT4111249.1 hypothetical protein [Candidatus Woesearchaeota archaeon]MBT4336829.1 hypothetical protein [Candidatus Woesearchaeota archaeon]MBT4469497.1 hypothetical protein [Candidatus Woesearchaeota archaeon]MBT6744108.1 hypothetical protein [Candidatus Woesearchaeota archaeon]